VFTLAQETEDDWWEVEALFDLAFAPGRTALSSYRLREDVAPVAALCRVARDENGTIGGAIRYWPVRVGACDALLLGPVAVHPIAQGEGLGAALVQACIDQARAGGSAGILLVGDAPYFGRFGFARTGGVTMPGPVDPARLLWLPVMAETVAGSVTIG